MQAVDVKGLTYKDMLDWRKDILAIVLTAFGAWIGAGAAYFFGRENLRTATEGMLSMRVQSPMERLRLTPISQVPPRPLSWVIKASDPLKPVYDKLKSDPDLWFIPVVKDDGTLETVIHEQAVWRFMLDNPSKESDERQVSAILNYLKTQKLTKLTDPFVRVKLDTSVSTAYDLMQTRNVFLALVLDDEGKPTHYITTTEVRKLLAKG